MARRREDYDPYDFPGDEPPADEQTLPTTTPDPPSTAPEPPPVVSSPPSRVLKPGESGSEESDYVGYVPPSVSRPPVSSGGGAPLPPVRGQPQGQPNQDILAQLMSRLQPQQFQTPAIPPEIIALLQQQDARRQSFEEAIRSQVLGLLQSNQQPINADEITNTPENRAFQRVQERALQRFRAEQAEGRASRGVGANQAGEISGPLQSDITGGQEAVAERMQAFESQLVSRELQNRRTQLMQALQIGAGILNQDQQQQIQKELANIDAQLRRELGQADIGLRGFLGGGQLSLGLLQTLLGNQQFYDRLGYDVGGQEAGFNQNALGYF